jgi:hypothetical protein
MVVGIDSAFVRAPNTQPGQRHQFEILTGLIETTHRTGKAFAVVRDVDQRAKQKVQALLRRNGRGRSTKSTVLADGEDGLRGVVGWFGKRCEHRLDWFQIARRIQRIRKDFFYLSSGPDFRRTPCKSLRKSEQHKMDALE